MASGKQLGTRFGNTIAILKAESVFLGAEEVISRNCHTGVQNSWYIPAEGGRFPLKHADAVGSTGRWGTPAVIVVIYQ